MGGSAAIFGIAALFLIKNPRLYSGGDFANSVDAVTST